MNFFIAPILSILLLFSACSKHKHLPPPDQKPAPIALTGVPPELSPGMLLSKKITSTQRKIAQDECARNILQIALGLRDAVRSKPHKIPALASCNVFTLDELPTTCTFSTTTINNDTRSITTSLSGRVESNLLKITIAGVDKSDAMHINPQTTLQFAPTNPSDLFSHNFLEQVYDTLEAGYASNEIGLMIAFDERQTTLCRRGSEHCMKITLEPHAICFFIDGYGVDPLEFLVTMLNMPKALSQKKEIPLMSKRVLFILMPHDFQDIEFSTPYNALIEAGHKVDIASLSSGVCSGMAGLQVTPTHLLSSMTPADFDQYEAVVIPGGKGSPTFLWDNEEVHEVVRYFHEHKKLVATICWACVVPVRAGILHNRKATVYPTDDTKRIFAENHVMFDDELCVPLEEERIITAQSPKAAKLFAAAILKQLQPKN